MPGLGGLQGVGAAGRSQEECRRGAGARRGVMNWNDSGGGGTFSRDRRGLLSPALVLANLPTFRLVGLLGSWWVVVRVLRSVSRKEGGERRKERQFTGGVREKEVRAQGGGYRVGGLAALRGSGSRRRARAGMQGVGGLVYRRVSEKERRWDV